MGKTTKIEGINLQKIGKWTGYVSSAPLLGLFSIIFKHVYWYIQQISGERLQDHLTLAVKKPPNWFKFFHRLPELRKYPNYACISMEASDICHGLPIIFSAVTFSIAMMDDILCHENEC